MLLPAITSGTTAAKTGVVTVDTGGLSAEVTTVSIPYNNEHGVEIGALVVLAPTYRMTPNRIKTELIPVLNDAMQRQHVQIHDSFQDKSVPLSPAVGREYAKYPHLVSGTSNNRCDTAWAARSMNQ